VPSTTVPVPSSSGGVLSSVFPIGVWVPPVGDFAKWRARGVNTVFGVPQGNDVAAWSNGAVSAGLLQMREPVWPLSGEAGLPSVTAWAQPDEPDGIFTQTSYAVLQDRYRAMKAARPSTPVLVNLVGDLNQYDLVTGESGAAWYAKYIAAADWIAADKYPVNACQPLSRIGQMVDTLRAWAGPKPVFAGLETNDYDTTDGCPAITADQMRGEIWTAIIHGVRGIYYFPERITPGFLFDNTPAAVAAELTVQNARVASLAGVLQPYAVNPPSLAAVVPAPLEAGWRDTPQGRYFFVLNLSPTARSAQTLSFSGVGAATSAEVVGEGRSVPVSGGRVVDDFGPYAVHVYRIP